MPLSRFALTTASLACALGCIPDAWTFPPPIDAAATDAIDDPRADPPADDATADAACDQCAPRCKAACADLCGRSPRNLYRGEGDARDSAADRHGAASPGVTYVAGRFGLAFNIDGAPNHVRLPAPVGDFEGDFTIALWFKSRYGGELLVRRAVCWDGPIFTGEDLGVSEVVAVEMFPVVRSEYFVARVPGRYLDDAWHHTALVRRGNLVDLVVDGQATASHPMAGSFTDPSGSPTYLGVGRCVAGAPGSNGNFDSRSWFRGVIDEVAFYDRALSPAELLAQAQGRCEP